MLDKVELVKMVIRVPIDVRDEIKNVSKKSLRSMNSEVVYRLKTSLKATAEDIVSANKD